MEPIESEFFRFHVRSRTRNQKWLVDLEPYGFNGQCGCEAFQFKCQPDLERGMPPSEKRRCDHIKRARTYLAEILFPLVAKNLALGQTVTVEPF